MFNANKPPESDLPSVGQLLRSTFIALCTALVLLVTIVLPAEYAIDLTGVGRLLQLTKMGEIKQQLAAESFAAAAASAKDPTITSPEPAAANTPARSDELTITLRPNEGVEYKMTMTSGAQVQYSWRVVGGVVNFDMHGTAPGGASEVSYKMQRGVAGDEGMLTADFDGKHGWFWRNRGTADVSITLRTSGAYEQLTRA